MLDLAAVFGLRRDDLTLVASRFTDPDWLPGDPDNSHRLDTVHRAAISPAPIITLGLTLILLIWMMPHSHGGKKKPGFKQQFRRLQKDFAQLAIDYAELWDANAKTRTESERTLLELETERAERAVFDRRLRQARDTYYRAHTNTDRLAIINGWLAWNDPLHPSRRQAETRSRSLSRSARQPP